MAQYANLDLLMLLSSIPRQHIGSFNFSDSLPLTIMGTGSGPKKCEARQEDALPK